MNADKSRGVARQKLIFEPKGNGEWGIGNGVAARQKPIFELSLPDGVPVPGGGVLLRGLGWRWLRGEQWGLVGANGAGKTLILRMIAGELIPPRGARLGYGFRASGKEPQDCVEIVSLERQRETMEAFDFYAQMRWNSTEEGAAPTLADFLSHDDSGAAPGSATAESAAANSAATRRSRRIVAALGLRRLLGRSLAELSSGENRRAFLARALLRRPKLLLLDSPFLGLDPESAALCLDTLAHAAARDGVHILSAAVREDDLPPFARKNVLRLDGAAPSANAPASARPATPARLPPPAAPKKIVELARINIAYGAVRVFKDFSWSISEGERWLLRGANGAGKSTLIALMLGDHLQSYSNDVRLFGRQRGTGESLWEIKARVGWVSPELHASLDPSQTVLEAVLSGFNDSPYSLGRHTRKQRAAARARLAEFGLGALADASFAALNSGAQRLALIARALVKEPPLLLLDEPCQNLDDANTRLVLNAVDSFCETHPRAALVYVTHRAGAAPRSANRELRIAPLA